MSALNLSEARKIGFNNSVSVEGVSLHVQTEVLTRSGIIVRTTVYDGGVTRFVETNAVPAYVSDMRALVALVETQHLRCFEHVKRGGATK
jgi:hypothetical protein